MEELGKRDNVRPLQGGFMKKIPVRQAIAQGYRFGFGRFVDLLRLLWLPSLVAGLCSYFTGDQMTLF